MEFYKTKIRPWIGICALLFIGYIMLTEPAPQPSDVHGRHSLLKSIAVAVWGIPAGVVCLLAGAGLGYVQLKSKPEEQEM